MTEPDPLLLKRALDAACVWHQHQVRKYPNASVPYASHVAGVVAVLAAHGFNAEVLAAGALHDVIEDCSVSPSVLTEQFGGRVSSLVVAVTEPERDRPWEERKARYAEAFSENPWDAQAITLADKIDNFSSILVCQALFGDPWAMFKRGRDVQLERFAELGSRARRLAPHPLVDHYFEMLGRLQAM